MTASLRSQEAENVTKGTSQSLFRTSINVAIFVSLSLFDFYIAGFRITEFFAYALLAVLVLAAYPRTDHLLTFGALFVVGTIYLLFGINNPANYETLKSAFGIYIALTAFILFSIYELQVSSRTVRILIWVNIAFFLNQFIVYYLFGYLVEYHWFTDLEQRLEGGSVVRIAGLYYEPAIYCLAMFMMSALLDPRDSKFNLTELVAALTMVLSFSFWGFVGAMFLVVRLGPYKPRVSIAAALIAMVLIYEFASLQNVDALDLTEYVLGRLGNLEFDNSTVDRYGSLVRLFQEPDITLLFGEGFGGPQDVYGGSTLGRLLTETGLVGFLAFTALLLRRSPRPLDFAFCLLPVLLAAAIVTYGFFGLWLSLMCQGRRRTEVTQHDPS